MRSLSFSVFQMIAIRSASRHRLAVVRLVALPVEIPLADDVGRQSEPLRRLRQNLFDDQHPLRPAESAKRGLRRLVRAAHAPGHLDGRQLVRVVDSETASAT